MRRQLSAGLILGLIVILLSIFWKINLSKNHSTGPVGIVSPTPTPTVNLEINTKDWKKFNNTRYGYSFMYPSDAYLQAYSAPVSEIPKSPYVLIAGGTTIHAAVSVLVNPNGMGDYYSRNCLSLDECISKSYSRLIKEAIVEDSEILGNKAKKVTLISSNKLYSVVSVDYFVILKNNFYNISIYSNTPPGADNEKEVAYLTKVADAFLAGFKFTK